MRVSRPRMRDHGGANLMALSLLEWRRGPRSSFALKPEPGVYALFLRNGDALNGIVASERGLLYIGLAAGRKGLLGRCHFHGRTRNHSPRKSLAVLLMDELALVPILVPKPGSADTWGLEASSEARFSTWMHNHLELAIETCEDPDTRETELVGHFGPPLNLAKCVQTSRHRRISDARAAVQVSLYPSSSLTKQAPFELAVSTPEDQTTTQRPATMNSPLTARSGQPVGTENDTAKAIAAHHHLNQKSLIRKLSGKIGALKIAWF